MRYLLAAMMQSVLVGSVWAYAADGDEEARRRYFVKGAKIGFLVFPISMAVGRLAAGGEGRDHARAQIARRPR